MTDVSILAHRYYRDLESALNEAGYTIYFDSITEYEGSIAHVVFSVGADVSHGRCVEDSSVVQFITVSDGNKVTRIADPTISYFPWTQDELVRQLQRELGELVENTPASPGVFARILAGQFRRLGFKK